MLNTALRFLVAVASAAILANAASAQGWPSKPVTYIVPFAAGSGPDVLARNISSELATKFRQPFIVENPTGRERQYRRRGRFEGRLSVSRGLARIDQSLPSPCHPTRRHMDQRHTHRQFAAIASKT